LDDGPALQEWSFLVAKHQAVAGFPDRGFLDVANTDRPLSLAKETERDGLFVVRFAGGADQERVAKLFVELFAFELDAAHAVERDAAEAIVGEQVQERGFDGGAVLAGGDLAFFDAEDRAGDFVRGVELDLLAADLVDDVGERRIVREVDAEGGQGAGERVFAAVADSGDAAAAFVLLDHALEQVVDVLDVEFHLDLGIAIDLAGVLEVGDAGAEHDDAFDGEVGGFFLGGGRRSHTEAQSHREKDEEWQRARHG